MRKQGWKQSKVEEEPGPREIEWARERDMEQVERRILKVHERRRVERTGPRGR